MKREADMLQHGQTYEEFPLQAECAAQWQSTGLQARCLGSDLQQHYMHTCTHTRHVHTCTHMHTANMHTDSIQEVKGD